jgi:hypothetical protein
VVAFLSVNRVINAPNVFAVLERFRMSNHRNKPLVRQPRRWGIAVGLGAGAVVATAMIGVAAAADAHADAADTGLGDAAADLTQATSVLDGAPDASLDAAQASILSLQEGVQNGALSTFLSSQESILSDLPAADQADLTGVDDQLASAYQGVLDADQAFAAADEAGDMSGSGFASADLGILDADFAVIPADFNAIFTDIGADLASAFDFSSLMP